MGKCSNAFFSETTNQTESKLDGNVHWMVLYRVYVFCSDIKWKMAAITGLSLTLYLMRKVYHNASSLKPLGQFKPNCPRMIIGRSSTKFWFLMPIGNPRWPPLQEMDTLDPMGKCSNAFLETTNMVKANVYMNVHWMVLYKLCFSFRYEIQNGGYDRT